MYTFGFGYGTSHFPHTTPVTLRVNISAPEDRCLHYEAESDAITRTLHDDVFVYNTLMCTGGVTAIDATGRVHTVTARFFSVSEKPHPLTRCPDGLLRFAAS